MATQNPHAGHDAQGEAWEQGYLAGFNLAGFNLAGFHLAGFKPAGFNPAGFDVAGFNVAGFNRAVSTVRDGEPRPRPLAPDLVDCYTQGRTAGRTDRRTRAPDGTAWRAPGSDWSDVIGHIVIHALGVTLEKVGLGMGGLVSLVGTVVPVPGDA